MERRAPFIRGADVLRHALRGVRTASELGLGGLPPQQGGYLESRGVTALELVSLLTQAIYVLIFVLVSWTALRRRTRTSVDTALFFGAIATAIVESRIVTTFGLSQGELTTDIVTLLVIAMPYLLLRLVDDFSDVPAVVTRLAEGGLVLSAIAFVVTEGTVPPPILIAVVLYFAALSTYCAVAFVRAGRRSAGVTRRRLEAVAAGPRLLGGAHLLGRLAPPPPGAPGGPARRVAPGVGLPVARASII